MFFIVNELFNLTTVNTLLLFVFNKSVGGGNIGSSGGSSFTSSLPVGSLEGLGKVMESSELWLMVLTGVYWLLCRWWEPLHIQLCWMCRYSALCHSCASPGADQWVLGGT